MPSHDEAGNTVRLGVQEKSFTTLNADNAAVVGPTLLAEREPPLRRALRNAGKSFASQILLAEVDAGFESSHDHIADLQGRVSALRTLATDARARIVAAEESNDAIPNHLRGWPLEIVMPLVVISTFFEYVPSSSYVQLFTAAGHTQQLLLAINFAAVGSLLALFLGEILRSSRGPGQRTSREYAFIALIGLMVAVFVALGYELCLATFDYQVADFNHSVRALALMTSSVIGMVLILIASYYREGFQSFLVRRRLKRLRGSLAKIEHRLQLAMRDLHRIWGSSTL